MRVLRKFLALVILCAGAALLGTAAYIYAYEDPDPLPRAAAIVVLSGPGAMDPMPVGETRARVERGVALWKRGLAPVIAMSGAGATLAETGNPDSRGMADLAASLGVPRSALLEEARSHSTLQNAWFTAALPGVDPSQPVILVSHRYHLPRAWASFRWAGFTDVSLIAADNGPPEVSANLAMEGVKWPLNLLRALGARAALALGAEEAAMLPWIE